MGKHAKKDYNSEPYDQQASDKQKAREFDWQYAENRQAGSDKEYSGQARPEPEGRGTNAY